MPEWGQLVNSRLALQIDSLCCWSDPTLSLLSLILSSLDSSYLPLPDTIHRLNCREVGKSLIFLHFLLGGGGGNIFPCWHACVPFGMLLFFHSFQSVDHSAVFNGSLLVTILGSTLKQNNCMNLPCISICWVVLCMCSIKRSRFGNPGFI